VLPNKCQALGSIHSTTKKRKRKENKLIRGDGLRVDSWGRRRSTDIIGQG
jgi:hypothetical protein